MVEQPQPTYITSLLTEDLKAEIIELLKEFTDYFAWDYHEMPGLEREKVEYQLTLKKVFKPFKQPPRRMTPKVVLKVKEEVERLLKAGFIRPIRYAEWLSNIIPMKK